jgi:3',5'-cyclic AMP phosphodiesterase CpdA
MNIDNQVKILWLSDIHFSHDYQNIKDGSFKIFLDSFEIELRKEIAAGNFDYVLLSGDLAQSGIENDYAALRVLLLAKIESAFKESGLECPFILTIPGNHDVNWGKKEIFNPFLKSRMANLGSDGDRNKFLVANVETFKELFAQYSAFVSGEPLFKPPADKTISEEYAKNRLFGYVVDTSKRLIFVLLNSAWYSLGDGFNNLLAAIYNNDSKWAKSKESLEELFKQKDNFVEYNSQIHGLSMFKELTQLHKLFEKYPDFIVLTCMHHPSNWMEWSEVYSYGEEKNSSAVRYDSLMQKTDILLTGHEHVPITTKNHLTSQKALHLKGGCFLFDRQHQKINLQYNWFSVLEIDTLKSTLHQKRFLYNGRWLPPQSFHEKLLKKNNSYLLTPDRRGQLEKDTKTFFATSAFLDYLAHNTKLTISNSSQVVYLTTKSDFHSAALYKNGGKSELWIMALSNKFYTGLPTPEFLEFLEDSVVNLDAPVSIIRFYIPDLLVHAAREEIYTQNVSRVVALDRIVRHADEQFDHFRLTFYKRFDDPSFEQKHGFQHFKDLCFANHIIPYWVLEQYVH